jgi:alcohol dehydrogenase class IV
VSAAGADDAVPTVPPSATVDGHGAIEELPSLVEETGGRRVLLICGRHSFEASGAARVLPALERHADVRRWDEHRPNPTAEDIRAGLAVAHAHQPDVIVGIGGGSTLDTAKVVAALHATDDGGDLDRLTLSIEGHALPGSRSVGLLLVPTTSGSGAQVTHFATVYVGATKHSVAGAALLPDRIVLDPALATTGSRYQRASSGIDALAQAIESLWSVGGDACSRDDAEAAIRLMMPALLAFADAPDRESAAAMARGSQRAGDAINRSRTTLPHALSYAITQQVGLPHGHAVAHTLPAVLAHHLAASDAAIVGVTPSEHRRTMKRLTEALGASGPDDAVARIERLIVDLGLRDSATSGHAAIVAQANLLAASVDPVRMHNNPVRFTPDALRTLVLAGTGAPADGRPLQ